MSGHGYCIFTSVLPAHTLRFGSLSSISPPFHLYSATPTIKRKSLWFPLRIEAREPTKTESAKVRNRRLQKKYNGTSEKPRLSIFCSGKHLYAELVDDSKRKILASVSTLQESIRGYPPCNTIEAAKHVGEEIVKACVEQDITQVSIDCNGHARGEKMEAFEIAIRQHGFLL
ncbi:hypothetical protein SUGI_0128740 [Cryptomeria japonica]|uniref:uncharacterized protein LOC131046333 n=1 Tax=Cryptomeria japonica TaxID=3369 RepID=UPI002408AE93|nr:uncharacterized protein LOC131046333 [Cryptomeria japonica]GLJ10466.1 hypothetical protein SUGI_0128740 [Cryptomeria japonica]